jgi:hypothetical protein
LNILLGIWLLVAPFILSYTSSIAQWNDIIVGIIVLVLAAIREWQPEEWSGLSWVNALAGAWLVFAPFILAYSSVTAALWNDIIVGIVVAVLAIWSAVSTPKAIPAQ